MPHTESNSPKTRLAGERRDPPPGPPAHGFLIADASLKLIFANSDAVTILTYPGPTSQNLVDLFQKKVRPVLANAIHSTTNGNGHSILKLKSGRRTYVCRAFLLNSNGKGNGSATLLMLERGMPGRFALSQAAQQFRLTHREQQAVALLLQGLSNKEIADIMGVSANTVKAFLRMATIRMGVSSRSGIVTKVLEVLLSGSSLERSPSTAGEKLLNA
jgi:DNA-binding CsgD family transcriptional regulator